MNIYFAHNGIDHASHMEEAAHQSSSTIIWILGITLVTIAAMYLVVRFLNSQQVKKDDKEKK
ncbi:MAG: hypothetical protein ACRD4B_09730 [Acidobacteriota bacterium]